MTKPIYRHPHFVIKTADKRIEKENKRLWLSLTINIKLKESLTVILKNPSRATKDISDKTVYTVTSYVHKNREKYPQLKNIGTVIILNLIPFYETYSELLAESNLKIIDKKNMQTINDLTLKHKNVIIGWGDHPKGLYKEYEELKKKALNTLKANKNNIFYVDKLSKNGNPKHGQVWGYDNKLLAYKF
jgi:hypothetical protein